MVTEAFAKGPKAFCCTDCMNDRIQWSTRSTLSSSHKKYFLWALRSRAISLKFNNKAHSDTLLWSTWTSPFNVNHNSSIKANFEMCNFSVHPSSRPQCQLAFLHEILFKGKMMLNGSPVMRDLSPWRRTHGFFSLSKPKTSYLSSGFISAYLYSDNPP